LASTPTATKAAYDAAIASVQTTQTISTTAPLTGGGDLSANRTLAVSAGSTSAAGVLQLTDSTSSTSTTTAATANAVKTAYDLANNKTFIIKTQSSTYVRTPSVGIGSVAATTNRTYYQPIYIDGSISVDRIAVYTTGTYAGTSSVRLGIYNHDITTGRPSTVLLDAGTVSVTTASTYFQITISQSLSSGYYWLAMNQQSTPTNSSYFGAQGSTGGFNMFMQSTSAPGGNLNQGYQQDSVTGAFATASSLSLSTAYPYAWVRTV